MNSLSVAWEIDDQDKNHYAPGYGCSTRQKRGDREHQHTPHVIEREKPDR